MKSIKNRLLTGLLSIIVLSTLIGVVITYYELKEEMDELFDENMKQIAYAIAVHNITEQSDFISSSHDVRRALKGEEEFLIQIWHGDKISYSSKPSIKFPNQGEGGVVTVQYHNEKWRHYGLDAGNGWLVQVSQPVPVRHTVIWEIYSEALVPALIQLPILIGLVWFVVGCGFVPLRRISESIARRTPQFLEKLPEEHIPREVFGMVRAINGLLDRLSLALDAQRRFTADAAHELRTPLAAVRLELDVLKRAETEEEKQHSIQKLYAAVDRSARLIHQLLEMARLEPEQEKAEIASVSLNRIVQKIVAETEQSAKAKGIDLRVEGTGEVFVDGSSHALDILVSNLVGNAIQYTPEGGEVVVCVSEDEGQAVLSVRDNGPGIPEKERARIFDRFYRILDKRQAGITGSGLGLSIVKSIVERHHARILIMDGPEGSGACFKITFPRTTR